MVHFEGSPDWSIANKVTSQLDIYPVCVFVARLAKKLVLAQNFKNE